MEALAPVMVGSDLGVYALARQFHEEYGVKSTTVAGLPRGFINDSRILHTRLVGEDAGDDAYLAALDSLSQAARASGRSPVLAVNSDSHVELVCAHRRWMEERFAVMVPPAESVEAVRNKALLAPLAAAVGLRTPREITISASTSWRAAVGGIRAPFIVKPATSGEWEHLHFAGKLKVYVCSSLDEAERRLETAFAAGYTGEMLLQELIPGDDTAGYVTTQYLDRSGDITVQATARMLLAIHTPNLLGNMSLGLVRWYPEIAEPVGALLANIGYRGLATADIKVHARTGEPYLLDINPRIGRSNYFLPMGGVFPLRAMLGDAAGESVPPQRTSREAIFRIVPFGLVRRYIVDPDLLADVRAVAHAGGVVHPLDYAADRNVRRTLFRHAASINHLRNLRAVYPNPTETSF